MHHLIRIFMENLVKKISFGYPVGAATIHSVAVHKVFDHLQRIYLIAILYRFIL